MKTFFRDKHGYMGLMQHGVIWGLRLPWRHGDKPTTAVYRLIPWCMGSFLALYMRLIYGFMGFINMAMWAPYVALCKLRLHGLHMDSPIWLCRTHICSYMRLTLYIALYKDSYMELSSPHGLIWGSTYARPVIWNNLYGLYVGLTCNQPYMETRHNLMWGSLSAMLRTCLYGLTGSCIIWRLTCMARQYGTHHCSVM
jgi:hypothetical protein